MNEKPDHTTPDNQSALLGLAEGRRVSRRDFMQYAAALGVAAGTASALWTRSAEAAPRRGGHLRVGSEGGSNTDSLDPRRAIGTNQFTTTVISVYDTLTYLDHNSRPIPGLAESWESDDAKTWRFKIRKDVEFHNGKTLTVDDVLASYAYEDNDLNTHGDSRSVMAAMEERKKDGDYLVVTLKTPNADLPVQLSAYGLIIAPAGTEEQTWNEPGLGTGPYRLKSFNPGVRSEVERNPNHYRDDEGFFDSAELLNIQDQASRTNAIRSGEVDVINRPDPKTAHLLAKIPGIVLTEVPGNQHYTMPMRMDTDPFTNNDIRLAVKYGVPRQEILKKILGGYGYLGNDHPIGKGQAYFNKELPQREVDPDRARFHLKQAGLSELNIELSASDSPWVGAVDAAQLVQEAARPGGINVTINRVAEDGYWTDTWLKAPWCLSYWGGRPTEDWMFQTAYSAESSWNESFMQHERFNKLLLLARGELNTELRRAMYYEMQEILYNEGGSVIPVFTSYLIAAKDNLAYADLTGTFDLDTFRIVRKWWFKA